MAEPSLVKVLKFYPERCNGCLACERACSQVHFKSNEGGDKSAIRIFKKGKTYEMHVCNQIGLCIDLCTVGALERRKNGVVWLDKDKCVGCLACVGFCPIGAMRKSDARAEPFKCISCGSCVRACPTKALQLVDVEIKDVKQVVYYKLGVDQ